MFKKISLINVKGRACAIFGQAIIIILYLHIGYYNNNTATSRIQEYDITDWGINIIIVTPEITGEIITLTQNN